MSVAGKKANLQFGTTHSTARRPKREQCPVAGSCADYPVSVAPKARPVGKSAERFEGSNRYDRGRILAVFRERADETVDSIPLAELGAQVKPEFVASEVPWLYDVVAGLAKDGLTRISEDRPLYDPMGGDAEICVRLPN